MPDTRDIIATSIASIREDGPADGGPEPTNADTVVDETSDTSDPGETPDPAADAKPGDAVVPDKPEEKKPEEKPADNDDVAKEPEFTTDKNGRKIVNRIPQPRVTKMVEASVKRAVEAAQAEHATKIAEYDSRIKNYDAIGEIMERDPDRFMKMLADTHPEYRAYVKGDAAPAAKPTPAVADDPEPQPNTTLPDGSPAYTQEQWAKLREWDRRQAKRDALDDVKKQYGWLDDVKAANDQQAQDVKAMRSTMDDAKSWEGFEENRADILKAMQEDTVQAQRNGGKFKFKGLAAAYRHVLNAKHAANVEKLKTDRNKLREEILAEQRAKPTSTAVVPAAPVTKPDPKEDDGSPRDTRDIIRESIAGLKR